MLESEDGRLAFLMAFSGAVALAPIPRPSVTTRRPEIAPRPPLGIVDRGAWALDDLARGRLLETKLGKNTDYGFPYIDRWEADTGTAISIKTTRIDRGLKVLEAELRDYVRKIASFKPLIEKRGYIRYKGFQIDLDKIVRRGLRVGIEPGKTTAAHRTLFERLREYATDQGLDFVEFVQVK